MESVVEVIRIFGDIARLGRPVKLYNAYRGVPIVYDAQVLSVDPWYVTLGVHEFQSVCLALEGMTYIQSDLLPEVLRARCINVDVKGCEARLTEFAPGGPSAGKRAAARVQPREPTDVQIKDSGNSAVSGILADVSTDGLGVVTFATYTYGELPFGKGADVFVDLRLPGVDRMVRFQGKIASVFAKGKFTNRLGLKLQPDPSVAPLLREYIAMRQEEILLELRGVYESMCREKKKSGPLGLRPD